MPFYQDIGIISTGTIRWNWKHVLGLFKISFVLWHYNRYPVLMKDENITAWHFLKKIKIKGKIWVITQISFKAATWKTLHLNTQILFQSLLFSNTYKNTFSFGYLHECIKSIDSECAALYGGLCGCTGALDGSWTRWTWGLWTPRGPQVSFPLPVPHCEFLFGFKCQGDKAICICHKYNPQWSWRKEKKEHKRVSSA